MIFLKVGDLHLFNEGGKVEERALGFINGSFDLESGFCFPLYMVTKEGVRWLCILLLWVEEKVNGISSHRFGFSFCQHLPAYRVFYSVGFQEKTYKKIHSKLSCATYRCPAIIALWQRRIPRSLSAVLRDHIPLWSKLLYLCKNTASLTHSNALPSLNFFITLIHVEREWLWTQTIPDSSTDSTC